MSREALVPQFIHPYKIYRHIYTNSMAYECLYIEVYRPMADLISGGGGIRRIRGSWHSIAQPHVKGVSIGQSVHQSSNNFTTV